MGITIIIYLLQQQHRYAADGRKLYTEYFTKITQLTTPIDTGAIYNYVFNRNLMTQTGTDYIGNIEYRTTLTATGKQYVLQRVHNQPARRLFSKNAVNPYKRIKSSVFIGVSSRVSRIILRPILIAIVHLYHALQALYIFSIFSISTQ